MNDYSDLMLAIGAMVIFAILLMNTNASLLRSDTMQVETELEHTAISLAQSVIEEARLKPFEHINSNYGRRMAGSRVPENANFEDGSISWPVETQFGQYELEMYLYYIERDFPDIKVIDQTDYQRMDVIVTSDFLSNSIKLSYIKSNYE